ncbi:MAG: hypothetical protein RLZZ531_871 [Bacteroidota bacterium]|jgi:hypothetical protein
MVTFLLDIRYNLPVYVTKKIKKTFKKVLQIQKEYISLHPATEINNGLSNGKKSEKVK